MNCKFLVLLGIVSASGLIVEKEMNLDQMMVSCSSLVNY